MNRRPAWVALGANLGEPRRQVAAGFDALTFLPDTTLAARSRIWRSRPLTPEGESPDNQPDYANAVARLETALAPAPLLAALHGLEAAAGRVRERRWGPRLLDLDLLLYDDERSDTPELRLPHPGLLVRDFVLYPLAEIDPRLPLPNGRTVAAQLDELPAGERPVPREDADE